MHSAVYAFVVETVRSFPKRERVLEIGSRNINGSLRGLFPDVRWYCGIDLAPGDDVDCVADGATFRTLEAPDTVVCCEVLEHAKDAELIVLNSFEQLAPNGIAIFTMATEGRAPHSASDGGDLAPGEFYRNVSTHELLIWCRPFRTVRIRAFPERGDLFAVALKAGPDA